MQLRRRHPWNATPAEAVHVQRELAGELADRPLDVAGLRTVAGVDVSVRDGISRAAVVVMSYPGLEPVETMMAARPTPFPYVPGLLTFREGPVIEEALGRLRTVPGVLLFDGMGRIHPRRMGIAAHMDVLLEHPTVGCGKTPFVGRHNPLPEQQGAHVDLVDRGEVIGAVVRTRERVKEALDTGQRAWLAGWVAEPSDEGSQDGTRAACIGAVVVGVTGLEPVTSAL